MKMNGEDLKTPRELLFKVFSDGELESLEKMMWGNDEDRAFAVALIVQRYPEYEKACQDMRFRKEYEPKIPEATFAWADIEKSEADDNL